MTRTRCKFTCWHVQEMKDHKGEVYAQQVKLGATSPRVWNQTKGEEVEDPSIEENKQFWKASPSGSFDIEIQNPAVFGSFVPGLDYYFDISLCPEEFQSNKQVFHEAVEAGTVNQ